MAFNPFHHFRRYSKVVFAGLAIICMLTFVLSSGMGRGDLLTQLTDIFSSGSRRGSEVITLYGKKYDIRQVIATSRGRQLASAYMEYATGAAQRNLFQRVSANVQKLDGVWQQTAQEIVQARLLMSFGQQFAERYRQILQNLPSHLQFLQLYIKEAEKANKTDDANTLGAIANMLLLDARLMARDSNQGYFGGRINQDGNYEETADFLIWMHHADKLGINLSKSDVNNAIAIETLGELGPEDAKQIDKALRDQTRDGYYTVENLNAALSDELRVRLARAALTGDALRTRSAVPGGSLTPEESWALFKDARTTVQVSMIDVPVRPFLDQVRAVPADEELRKLYDKYRDQEPAPYKDTPGFKEPRKIQVEWIGGDQASDYYRKAAAKIAPLSAAVAQMGCALGGLPTGSGTGIPEIVHAAAPFAFADAPLQSQLDDYRRRELPWTESLGQKLHDTSIVRADNIAVLAAAAAGAMGTGMPPILSAPLAFEAQAQRNEAIDRAKIGVAMIGLGAAADPVPFGLFGAPHDNIPKPLAFSVLKPLLAEKAQVNLARALVQADFAALRTELTKLGQDKDKTKAPKYVADFIKERGVIHGVTSEVNDIWSLGNDPGLAPLKELYRRGHAAQDVLLRGFAFEFFNEKSMMGEAGGVFVPRTYFAFGSNEEKSYLYWLTEDQPARTVTFDKARTKVEAAWKELEARKLAQKEAERLSELAKRKQGDRMQLRDLAVGADNREYFELGPMARFMPQANPNPFAGQRRQYTSYELPQDRIPWPSDDFLTQLLGLREKETGATIVVSDRPKDHFFVASLLHREEPAQEEFRRSYIHSMARATESDPLLPTLAADSRMKYYQEVLKQLRADANLVINRDARKPAREEEPAEQ